MFWYLFPIFTSGNTFTNPDSSQVYSFAITKKSVFSLSNSSIYIITESDSSDVIQLSNDFREMFKYQLGGNNQYEAVSIQVGSQIFAAFNLNYSGDPIPGLAGDYPVIGTMNGLLMTFNFQGNLIKSQWTSFCKTSNSLILDYKLSNRHFFTIKNSCNNQSICIIGLSGEQPVCFSSDWNSVKFTQDSSGSIYYSLTNDSSTTILNSSNQVIIETNTQILDFFVGSGVFLVSSFTVSKYSINGTLMNSFQMPSSFNIFSLFTEQNLYIAFNTNISFIDFPSQNQLSTVLLQLNSTLSLTNYRVYSSANPLQSFNALPTSFYFLTQSTLQQSQNPFSVTFIDNCSVSTKNILGETLCNTCKTGFVLLGNHCIQDFLCPSSSIKDFYTLSCVHCYEGCAQCIGPYANQCVSCQSNYSFFGSECLVNCPNGYYSVNDECQKCGFDCVSCDTRQCYVCGSQFLFNGSCVSQCPSPYKPVGQQCELCNSVNCQICDPSLCSTCTEGFFLSSGKCEQCSELCVSCESFLVCSECKPGYQLVNGSCISCMNCKKCLNQTCVECSFGYFLGKSESCEKCELNCDSCDSNGCIECSSGYELINRTCIECTNSSSCNSCGANCSNCVNSTCLECETGVLFQGTCLNNCPKGYESINSTCQSCPLNCDSCSQSTCSVCSTNYTANGYYVLTNSSCSTFECFPDYYPSQSGCSKSSTLSSTFLPVLYSCKK